jgi:hypothetical protein
MPRRGCVMPDFWRVQSGTMLDVMDEARLGSGEAHAAWSDRFNKMFRGVAGKFETELVYRARRPRPGGCQRKRAESAISNVPRLSASPALRAGSDVL